MLTQTEKLTLTPEQAALICLMHHYLSVGLDIAVTLPEAHHFMYLMQAAGEPLNFQFVRTAHGLRSDSVLRILRRMENQFITFGPNEQGILQAPLYLKPGAVEQMQKVLLNNESTLERCNRVAALFEGFEMGYGINLLVKVHWAVTQEQAATAAAAGDKIYFRDSHHQVSDTYDIEFTWNHLQKKGWL